MGVSHIVQPEKLYTVRPRSLLSTDDLSVARGQTGVLRLINYASSKHQLRNAPEKRGLKELTATSGFSPFLIQSMQMSFDEKVQVTPTFGDGHVAYYFGNNPIMMHIEGVTFDDIDNGWFVDFLSTYAEVMRGTRLAQAYELIELDLPNINVTGTIQNLNFSQRAESDTIIQFSMNILVKFVVPNTISFDTGDLDPLTDAANLQLLNFQQASSTGDQTFYNNAQILALKQAYVPDYSGLNGGYVFWQDGKGRRKSTSSTDYFASSIFAPVYGIISDIRSMVNSFFSSINSTLTSILQPISDVLNAVQNFENAVSGVVSSINSGVDGFFSGLSNALSPITNLVNQAQQIAGTYQNIRGTISQMPETFASKLTKLGLMGKFDPMALLGLSNPYTLPYKKAMLTQVPVAPSSAIPINTQVPPSPALPLSGISLPTGRNIIPTIPIFNPAAAVTS